MNIEVGKTYKVKYPFTLEEVENLGFTKIVTKKVWRPGVRSEPVYPDDSKLFADSEGQMLLTVVDTHKLPGRYQQRVFYTRKWICPDGSEFGKNNLRISTRNYFIEKASGYYYDYEVDSND